MDWKNNPLILIGSRDAIFNGNGMAIMDSQRPVELETTDELWAVVPDTAESGTYIVQLIVEYE